MGGQGKSRRSSIHAASTAAADPRPLTDIDFRSQCTRNLIQFLTQNGYGHPMSQKMLTAPSDQTFFQIFQFLYHKIDPEYSFDALADANSRKSVGGREAGKKATASMVEQVPMLLKSLGYPFKINKSAFVCVGSSSTWPKILGALHFLLEIATLQETVDINAYIFAEDVIGGNSFDDTPGSGNTERNELMFEYMSEAYCAFLGGDDEMKSQLDEEMLADFKSVNSELEQKLAATLAEGEAKKAEMQARQSTVSDLPEMMAKDDELNTDHATMNALIANLEGWTIKMNKKLANTDADLELKIQQRAGLVAEQARLQDQCDTQELTPADVEKITQAKSQLDKDMETVLARKAEVEKRMWKQEEVVKTLHAGAQKMVAEYNARAEQLHLIPAESKIADGVDFELHVNSAAAHTGQPLVLNNIKGALLENLAQYKEKINDAVHKANGNTLTQKALQEQAAEKVADANARIQAAEKTLANEEDRYGQKKLASAEENAAWDREISTLQEDAIHVQEEINIAQGKSSETQAADSKLWAELEASFAQEMEEMEALICETGELIQAHKTQCDAAAREYADAVAGCK